MNENEKKKFTRDEIDEIARKTMAFLAIIDEIKAFRAGLEDYDEDPEKICYRLFIALREVAAYSCQLAVNSLAEGDEKTAERFMKVTNMIGAFTPIPLFDDFEIGEEQEVKFTSDKKTKDSIVIASRNTGKVHISGSTVPDTEDYPENICELLFGPLTKIGEDEEEDEDEEDNEEDTEC